MPDLVTPVSPPRLRAVALTTLPAGAVATLHEVRDPESQQFLRSLGLTAASRLRLCKAGDPCIIQVHATRIGVSGAVAQHLFVVPDAGADR